MYRFEIFLFFLMIFLWTKKDSLRRAFRRHFQNYLRIRPSSFRYRDIPWMLSFPQHSTPPWDIKSLWTKKAKEIRILKPCILCGEVFKSTDLQSHKRNHSKLSIFESNAHCFKVSYRTFLSGKLSVFIVTAPNFQNMSAIPLSLMGYLRIHLKSCYMP